MKKIFILLFFSLLLVQCTIKHQVDEATTFTRCDFRFQQITDLRLADMDIQNIHSVSDLNFKKAVRLATALTHEEIPLTFTVWVDVYNPNNEKAALNRLEWNCQIEEQEIARGILDQRVEIRPKSAGEFSVRVQTDIKKLFHQKNKDAFLNLIFNLTGKEGEPVHLRVNLRPSIKILGTEIEYPGWIRLEKDFTSEDGKKIQKTIKKKL